VLNLVTLVIVESPTPYEVSACFVFVSALSAFVFFVARGPLIYFTYGMKCPANERRIMLGTAEVSLFIVPHL
jgi:hypothetical protein